MAKTCKIGFLILQKTPAHKKTALTISHFFLSVHTFIMVGEELLPVLQSPNNHGGSNINKKVSSWNKQFFLPLNSGTVNEGNAATPPSFDPCGELLT